MFTIEAHRSFSDALPARAGTASPAFSLACSATRRRTTTGRLRLRNTRLAFTTARSLALSLPPLLTVRMVNFSMFWGNKASGGDGARGCFVT